MNRKTMRQLFDGIIVIALSSLLGIFLVFSIIPQQGHAVALGLLPIIWGALRYGTAFAALVGTIAGVIIGGFSHNWQNILAQIVSYVLAYALAGALAGLFAKYTQKTLNNARYKSTYLNIVTASLLTSLAYYLVHSFIAPYALGTLEVNPFMQGGFYLAIGLTALLAIIALIAMARSNKSLLIPKGTKYLTRKETSSLLND